MKRREFIGAVGALASGTLPLSSFAGPEDRMHIVSLSFDDGFRKSFIRTAEIYEKFGLSACFNVTAAGNRPESPIADDYVGPGQLGDFTLWNELRERGHEIMPHGYNHVHKDRIPFEQAKKLIEACLEIFVSELRGFDPERAVFNFPYNVTTPEISSWITTRVRAYRCHGPMINPLPHADLVRIGTGGWGPGNAEAHLDKTIEELLARESGWLVYNLHGLDDEGWGPIRAEYLERLLARLVQIDSVRVMPTAAALLQA